MSPHDQLALATRDLEPAIADAIRNAFAAFFAQTEEWATKAGAIQVTDASQTREMRMARESRLALKDIRTSAEAVRKRLKEPYLRAGQAIDALARVIKERIEPIEATLLEQEEFGKRLEAKRVAELRSFLDLAIVEGCNDVTAAPEPQDSDPFLPLPSASDADECGPFHGSPSAEAAPPAAAVASEPAHAPSSPAPSPPSAPTARVVRLPVLRNGSASSTERTLECPAWLAFPRVERETEAATRGNIIHAYGRAVLTGTPVDVALAKVDPKYRETCRKIDWRKLCGDIEEIETEAAYALDVKARTARFLGFNIGRNYAAAAERTGQPLGEWEIPGSLDLAGFVRGARRVVVSDLKTGFMDIEADANAQGLFFAAVKSILLGVTEVEFRIAKLKPNGDVWNDPVVFTAFQIDTYLDELEAKVARAHEEQAFYAAGGMPDVHDGDWCYFCPASDACPAKTALARSMVSTLKGFESRLDVMTADEWAQAYEYVHDQAMPIAKRILEAAKDRARRDPYPLSSGLVLREAPYEKDSLVTESVIELARKLGATTKQIDACYRESTVRQVRACKPDHAQQKRAG